ncbi:hypothetical protein [Actinoplanes aureus]|uniref:Uncharacterized protein n=1 Tax=Actinoplanes aureus TaxID=2792083 RepID=A0A931FYR8_9ACTN|nr:hypothetical protein [Actinoplanes aureus]MBG0564027.1 hypothetical protein [Actinoplanes aureus]
MSGVREGDLPDRPLSVKVDAGGTTGENAWIGAVSELERSLESAVSTESSPFNLAVTYFISGRTYAPGFRGMRVGFYLSKYRTLVIQIVLPASPPEDGARAELLRVLGPAVDRAEAWGRRKRLLDGELTAVRTALAEVSREEMNERD